MLGGDESAMNCLLLAGLLSGLLHTNITVTRVNITIAEMNINITNLLAEIGYSVKKLPEDRYNGCEGV